MNIFLNQMKAVEIARKKHGNSLLSVHLVREDGTYRLRLLLERKPYLFYIYIIVRVREANLNNSRSSIKEVNLTTQVPN